MNKKITTLLASAMLATAFSAGASINAKKGEATLLGASSDYLSVSTGSNYGALSFNAANLYDLKVLNPATWTVSDVKTSLGQTLYSFVNKATGLTLSVDPATAIAVDDNNKSQKIANAAPLALGGSASEWVVETVNGKDILVSYIDGETVVYIAQSGNKLYLEKAKKNAISSAAIALSSDQTSIPKDIDLDSNALNTLLHSVKGNSAVIAKMFFGLTMNPETSGNNKNVLTATALHAETVETDPVSGYWVTLQAKDQKIGDEKAYVVVDTAYYDGTETSKFLKFAYDELNADGRKDGSYKFKFTYNAQKDELYAQVKEVAYKITKKNGVSDADFAKWVKEKNNNSNWVLSDNTSSAKGSQASATSKYVYMARLAGTNVLTVNTNETDNSGALQGEDNVQKTVIKLGTNFSGLTQTTLADGVYMIQYKSTGGNKPEQNDAYALANLAGNFGWAKQADRQDFNHIPAAQWVITKNGTASTASITIQNREFYDVSETSVGLNKKTVQLYAVKDSKDVFFYNGSSADTLSFIPVEDAKNLKVGYRYLTEDSAKVQTYVFNYLHGLALDKYLYTPAGKDSIVRVNENGDKTNFRLEIVVKDDNYGVGDSLVRNVYYVKNGESYLSYDNVAKKYMMKKDEKTPFFLKENNCVDGKHYYALVEANLGTAYDKDGDEFKYVKDYSEFEAYDSNGNKKTYNDHSSANVTYSNEYTNGVKVSVDDNTLDLLQGSTNDKFNQGNNRELRTSAFAVMTDDSPLYRRFNNVALGESATDAADSLAFVESVRGEYLMDEWNKNLQDKTVDYAGIWNQDKADGKLFFHVDTAWVNRGAGNIKPQYLISVARQDQPGTPGVPCTYEHNHFDNAGNKVDAAHCSHATPAHAGFAYGKYLVNFSDSAKVYDDRKVANPYKLSTNSSANSSYTRVGFVKAIHMGDSLYVLTNGFEKMAPADLDTATIIANYKKAKIEHFIVNLTGDQHKNVTWSFRYVNPDKAGNVAEEGADNSFLFESNVYGSAKVNGQTVNDGQYTTVYGNKDEAIAPTEKTAWLKMHNGCLVITDNNARFDNAKTSGDGALIFNVVRMVEDDQFATSNDEIAAEGITIVAGNGTVTVQGAAGKSVVITNILGKIIAETVLTSDNATISVPAGIVAVAVDGEEAVKAIVK
ncbi:DUF6383 domain-containing protein [uncultured Parabacteroides sp.]|uniref:DUF6383 domain-containing protein n=1 Tax=uncultured Parabacteroides sp. TaxID=512312 RepID=UPI002603122E|nr:DUF6383 domain-containing protein [uncultured Parabacteroides sp.]